MFALLASILAILLAAGLYGAWVRKSYEKRLQQLIDEVRDAKLLLRKKGEVAAAVAHEIKNPITAILCSAEALDLLIGDSLEPVHRKSVRYIREYADYVLRLMSDYLDLNMLDAGAKEAHPRQVDVYATVESVVGLLDSFASKKQIRVQHHASSDNLLIQADPRHFRQMLFNLIHNAIKFSPAGGEVRVLCQDTFPLKYVKISVKDSGPGLTEKEVAALFNHKWGEHRETGHGLGLAVTRALMDLAGGSISVSSQPGIGTCFDLILPSCEDRRRESFDDSDVQLASRAKPLRGCRILIVDSDEGARSAIGTLIEAWGGMVRQVEEAQEALRSLAVEEYDALMLDAGCEFNVAEELLKTARECQPSGRAHIIMTSTGPIKDEVSGKLGPDQIVEKPISGKILLESLLNATRIVLPH